MSASLYISLPEKKKGDRTFLLCRSQKAEVSVSKPMLKMNEPAKIVETYVELRFMIEL
jgi:hypothetical protein